MMRSVVSADSKCPWAIELAAWGTDERRRAVEVARAVAVEKEGPAVPIHSKNTDPAVVGDGGRQEEVERVGDGVLFELDERTSVAPKPHGQRCRPKSIDLPEDHIGQAISVEIEAGNGGRGVGQRGHARGRGEPAIRLTQEDVDGVIQRDDRVEVAIPVGVAEREPYPCALEGVGRRRLKLVKSSRGPARPGGVSRGARRRRDRGERTPRGAAAWTRPGHRAGGGTGARRGRASGGGSHGR